MRTERNINDEVIVKLTPEGERVYTMNCIGNRSRLNNDGVYNFQIWDFMAIFGPEIHHGMQKLLFVSNKLVFPDPEKYNLGLETFNEMLKNENS